jgi:hypothetical protein
MSVPKFHGFPRWQENVTCRLLDEVGDIPLDLQLKLLRALQDKSFERLGSTRAIPIRCPPDCGDHPESGPDDGR